MTTSSQTGRVVDEVRTLLAARGDEQTLRRLIPASIRLLAEGEPVSPAQIADAAGAPVDQGADCAYRRSSTLTLTARSLTGISDPAAIATCWHST
jgi:hypothetical protein